MLNQGISAIGTSWREPIILPCNKEGIYAYKLIKSVAERIWATAQDLTAELVRGVLPGAETINERFHGGKYLRTVRTPDGQREIIAYDYHTKEVSVLMPENMEE